MKNRKKIQLISGTAFLLACGAHWYGLRYCFAGMMANLDVPDDGPLPAFYKYEAVANVLVKPLIWLGNGPYSPVLWLMNSAAWGIAAAFTVYLLTKTVSKDSTMQGSITSE